MLPIASLIPDIGLSETPHVAPIPLSGAPSTFGAALDAAGASLTRADAAETAFTRGTGGLAEMVIERARADIALSVAATGAQRAAQALNTLLGMQV
jgi:flagellar hook-basal body complex protein FliE